MIKPDKILFDAEMRATGGREGIAVSPDGSFRLDLSVPKALGGTGGPGTNPEQLFAAGYAACFLGAVKLMARTQKVTLPDDVTVTAKVGMGPVASGYGLAVELIVEAPGVDKSALRSIVGAAHERCPYSNATRGNIEVLLTVA